jgi:membrane associated rhomboid family serine protease
MLENISAELTFFIENSRSVMPLLLKIMGGLWAFNVFNWATGSRLNILGLVPRKAYGLPGVIFSPLLHADFTHLLFNTLPFFALSLFIMSIGVSVYIEATLIICLIQGLLLWSFGRKGNHIGASGLIAGYFAFILAQAIERPSITTLFAGSIALYYFGGILFSLLPTKERISWEGHLFGFLAGVFTVLFLSGFFHKKLPYLALLRI